MRTIKSTKYGEMKIEDKSIINFKNGLPGFDEMREFSYIPLKEDSPFGYLQSLQSADLTFIVIDPFVFFPDYDFEIDEEAVKELEFNGEDRPFICNIVTVLEGLKSMTANLLAPIIVNWRVGKGIQYVLSEGRYQTKHLVFPNGVPKMKE